MKIVYVSVLDAFGQTGAAEHIRGVVCGLDRCGHEVHLVAGATHGQLLGDVQTHFVPFSEEHSRSVFRNVYTISRRAREVVRRGQPDVVYLRSFPLDYLFVGRWLSNYGVPYGYEMNAVTDREYRAKGQRLRGYLYRLSDAWSCTRSLAWFPAASEVAEYMGRVSSSARPWRLADNGVWPARWRANRSREDVRRELDTHEEAKVIIMAGFDRPWHGVDRAIAMLPEMDESVVLWLVGAKTEHDRERVAAIARKLGVMHRIRVAGWMDKRQLANVIASADVGLGALALDRKGMTEVQAVKIGPYLAVGIPVLLNCRDPRLPDDLSFIQRVDSTLPAALSKGINTLLNAPATKERIQRFAREHLSWDQVAQRTAAFLASALRDARAL